MIYKKFIIIICALIFPITYSTAQTLTISEQELSRLVSSFPSSYIPRSFVLYLYGKLIDQNGKPVAGHTIEIWQTDSNGIYDHPLDQQTTRKDISFQFFGTSVTDNNGLYVFRTILPGEYTPRPRHIHFKIKNDNNKTLLTSQFYFQEESQLAENTDIFQATSPEDIPSLWLPLVEYNNTFIARGVVILKTKTKNSVFAHTKSQPTGPFYPVQKLSIFDNDLLILNTEEQHNR